MRGLTSMTQHSDTTLHYNDSVKLEFDPKWHTYRMNGKKVDGVTTALQLLAKPALIMWAAKKAGEHVSETLVPGVGLDEMQISQLAKDAQMAHRNNKDMAAEMGSKIHDWIEKYVAGESPPEPLHEGMKKATQSFVEWYKTQNIRPLFTEKRLCSVNYEFAGTADLVCELDGKLTILDWKTGSGIYPEMFLQLGAYATMYTEEFGAEVKQIGIVNCSARAPFAVKRESRVEMMSTLYKDVLALYRHIKRLEEEFKDATS